MSCCLFYYHLASQIDPKLFKRVIAFWFSSPYTLDSGLTPARSEIKPLKACQLPQFLHRIIVQG